MPHTRFDKTPTAMLRAYGKLWDSNFYQNSRTYWTKIWRSTNRTKHLKDIEQALAGMQHSRDEHVACDFYQDALSIQNSGYELRQLRPGNPPQSKAKSAKSGSDEILALVAAPFVDGVYGDADSKLLRIVTAPVEIRTKTCVYQMGQYQIRLDFNAIPVLSSRMLIEPHRTRFYGEYHHHHVYASGTYCGGEAEEPMKKLFSSGLLYEAVAFIFNYLQSPASGGYVALDYFMPSGSASARPFCGHCKKPPGVTGLIHCKQCKIALCADTCGKQKTCPYCGAKLPKQKAVKKKRTPKKSNTRHEINRHPAYSGDHRITGTSDFTFLTEA